MRGRRCPTHGDRSDSQREPSEGAHEHSWQQRSRSRRSWSSRSRRFGARPRADQPRRRRFEALDDRLARPRRAVADRARALRRRAEGVPTWPRSRRSTTRSLIASRALARWSRVVVTGVGAVTPLGVGADALHERWSAGVCGIERRRGRLPRLRPARLPLGQGGAPRRPLHAARDRRLRRGARRRRLGGRAALRPARVGCVLGTGIGGIAHAARRPGRAARAAARETVSPLAVPLMMSNAAAAALSMRYGLRGPSLAVSTACASGAHAIGCALRMIQTRRRRRGRRGRRRGRADAACARGLLGALDATLAERHLAPVRRAPRRLRDGRGRRRAGARARRGRARRAAQRRAATIRGYGATSDAHHLTAPREDGGGRRRRCRAALADAGARPRARSTTSTRTAPRRRSTTAPRRTRSSSRSASTRWRDPGLLDEVGDRAPARRGRRGRGGRDAARAARRARAADARARPSRTRASTSTTCPGRARPLRSNGRAAARALELVRLRRPQRGALPGGRVTLALAGAPRGAALAARAPRGAGRPRLAAAAAHGVLSRRMGERARAGDGVLVGARAGRRPRRSTATRRTPPSSAARSASAHARDVAEVLRLAGRARVPVVGLRRVGRARACRRGSRRSPATGAIFREHVRLSGLVPADLGRLRRCCRRRLLRPGAQRLRDHELARARCS